MVRTALGWFWVAMRRWQAGALRWRNRRRPRVFLFADSRAVDVSRKYTKKDPLTGYPLQIIRRYSVRARIVPYRHTTIVDFLAEYEQLDDWQPDLVVAHVGIVDFSPRPRMDAIERVYGSKKIRYDRIFGEETMRRHLSGELGCTYEGQPTINMFSLKSASESLLPRLRRIPNLVFVGCNRFVPGWEGSYLRGRPRNIAMVESYSRLLCEGLQSSVSFDDWRDDDIQRYTVDNIHYTPEGTQAVSRRVLAAAEKVLAHDKSPEGNSEAIHHET